MLHFRLKLTPTTTTHLYRQGGKKVVFLGFCSLGDTRKGVGGLVGGGVMVNTMFLIWTNEKTKHTSKQTKKNNTIY